MIAPHRFPERSMRRAWLVGSSIETFDDFVRLPRASIHCLKNIAIRLRACAHWRRTMYFTIIAIDILTHTAYELPYSSLMAL